MLNINKRILTQKQLKNPALNPNNKRRTLTFYKSIQLKTIKTQPHYRIKSYKKRVQVQIENHPWNRSINPSEISILLKRLGDTPKILYQAIEKNKENIKNNNSNIGDKGNISENFNNSVGIINKNKFKPLSQLNLNNKDADNNSNNNRSHNKLLSMVKTQKNTRRDNIQLQKMHKKQLQNIKQGKILKRIQAAKKKYVQQYRKMLLGMKAINLDTDLPRIKYVEQNQMSHKINLLHAGSKL